MKRLLVCLLLAGVVGCGESDAEKALRESNEETSEYNKVMSAYERG
jgi:hypothetical protein